MTEDKETTETMSANVQSGTTTTLKEIVTRTAGTITGTATT